MEVLQRHDWQARADAHRRRADALTAGHRARRSRGEQHPVEDFLFTYYGFRPAQLHRWHPGPGVGLLDAPEHAARRDYSTRDGVTFLDVASFRERRGPAVVWVRKLLVAVESREPTFSCFGLHEWAMVYRAGADGVRHAALPLRLGPEGTDAVVEAHEIRCSHHDAFRFFTPDAVGRNTLQPSAGRQVELEQPGCLHGGVMDLYRWSFKLAPAVPGDLLLDCFELAREARVLDMRSSPYDLRPLGLQNIAIETPAGKAEHVRRQRDLSARGRPLRQRLIAVCDALLGEVVDAAGGPQGARAASGSTMMCP